MKFILGCIKEVYKFSLKKNSLDKDFAHWYVDNYS